MSIFWHITCLLLLRSCTPGFFIHGIVGGKDSVPHSRPYMVYIQDKVTKQSCGGFLVRGDYVMTSAHCKPRHLMVYLGVDDTKHLPEGVEVDPIPHPKFNNRPGRDIMLLKLKTPATLNKSVRTIALPKPENEGISKHCMVMGWGWKKYNHESPSNVLREASVTLIDSENCGVADTLCTEGSTGPAQGDGGAPLVCGGVAKGIVSFYTNKANGGYLTGRPYMVYIRDKVSKQACGGFLVREDFVMIAAHCKKSHLMVYLGVDDTNNLPDGVEVESFPHPRFNNRPGHDIMLLKLKTPATLNKNVRTIALPKTENEEISKDCMVMGWGWKKYNHESPSNVLREANVTLIDSENCGVADTLCSEGSTGPAQSDSGGPLVCGGVSQGIVSFTKNKANADQLTGYTHISRYLSWIHRVMSPDMPKISDQVSTPGTLDLTPGRGTPKPDKQQVLSDGIVGGKVSVPHSRPYMVYIRDKVSEEACGGFLVREDYVMTAAHCKQSHLMVYLGVDDTNNLPDGVEVDPVPNPRFNMKRNGHDIMLLKLKTPAILNKTVSTISLPKPENEGISKHCLVMGWGWKKYNHESPSNVLREASVTLIDSENCGVADTLCTEGSTGPVQGDFGALVCGGVALGIVSFTKNKANADQLTVYTHISRYLSWIHHVMSPDMPKILDQVSTPGTLDLTPDAKDQNPSAVFCLVPKT